LRHKIVDKLANKNANRLKKFKTQTNLGQFKSNINDIRQNNNTNTNTNDSLSKSESKTKLFDTDNISYNPNTLISPISSNISNIPIATNLSLEKIPNLKADETPPKELGLKIEELTRH